MISEDLQNPGQTAVHKYCFSLQRPEDHFYLRMEKGPDLRGSDLANCLSTLLTESGWA